MLTYPEHLKLLYFEFQKTMSILMYRVVYSVINLIEQEQGTNLLSVPQTTAFTLTQLSARITVKPNETPHT